MAFAKTLLSPGFITNPSVRCLLPHPDACLPPMGEVGHFLMGRSIGKAFISEGANIGF